MIYEELDGEECQIFFTEYFNYIIIVTTAVNEKKHERERETGCIKTQTHTHARTPIFNP